MAEMIKYFMRMLFGGFFFYAGIFHIVRFFYNVCGRRITIVTYHRITDRRISEIEASLPFLFTSQKVFNKHLKFIKKYYKVITLKELNQCINNNRLAWNSLIITFDDGYEDNFRNAYKTLCKMNLPATFFITVDKIGNQMVRPYWWDRLYYYLKEIQRKDGEGLNKEVNKDFFDIISEFNNNPSDVFSRMNKEETGDIEKLLDRIEDKYQISNEQLIRENTMLNWEQISEMSQNCDFGSHSCSHRNLLKLGDDQKYHEIVGSKVMLERFLNKKIQVFSCPTGHMDEEVEKFLIKGGYNFALTTKPGINKISGRYHLKRINIWEGTSLSLDGKFAKGYFSFKMMGF